MLAWLLLSAALLLPAVSADYADCPCIQDFPTNGSVLWQVERTLRAQGSSVSLRNFSLRFARDGQNCTAFAPPFHEHVMCYPADYGLGNCKAHDQGLGHRCNATDGKAPPWCGLQWCYIDPARCNVRHEKTRMFPMLDLHYSYVACGSEDLFSENAVEAQLARPLSDKAVRVTYGFQEAPYIFKNSEGRWDGVLFEFVNELADHLGFEITEVPISNDSLAKYGEAGANTACANDIALGLTDFCVANAWETPERVRLAHALPTWWQEHLYLVTFAAREQSFRETMLQVFTPFSVGLWAFIIGAVVVYSLLMWWAEIRHLHHGRTSGSCAYSFYMVLLGHLSASPMYMPKTLSGRFITVAFSFFVLIVIASYTANLASFLLQESITGRVDSLESALDAGMKICSWKTITPILEAKYPGISRQLVEMKADYGEAFADLGGSCEAMVIPKFAYDMAVGGLYTPGNPTAHCDKLLVGQPVVSLNALGLVAEHLLMSLSYFMVKYRSRGDLEKILARSEFQLPGTRCAAEEDVETEQLSVSSMLGTIVVSGALTVVGILIKCCCDWPRLGGGSGGPPGAAAAAAAAGEEEGAPAEAAALEGGLGRQPEQQPPPRPSRPSGHDGGEGRPRSSAPPLAVPAASAGGGPLRGPRSPWRAGARGAQDTELEAVRGAMEQVLVLLSQRQGAQSCVVERPPTLLEKVAAESADAKVLLREMQL